MELLLKHGAKVYYKAYSARLSIDACGSTQANLCGWIERSRNTVNLKEFLKGTFKGTKETLSRVMPTFLWIGHRVLVMFTFCASVPSIYLYYILHESGNTYKSLHNTYLYYGNWGKPYIKKNICWTLPLPLCFLFRQECIICKILWWWGKWPLGEIMKNEDLGEKIKKRERKRLEKCIKTG